MSPPVPEIVLIELYNQCSFAAQAHAAANSALDRFGKGPADTIGPGRRHQREVFRNLESLLLHAAHVASLLWPPASLDDDARERAGALRARLELPDGDHVLRRVPEATDAAPYAVRLDRWLADRDPERAYLDHITAPDETLDTVSAERRMRTFDPASGELQIRGERVPVRELAHAIKRLALRTERLLENVDGVRLRHEPGGGRRP